MSCSRIGGRPGLQNRGHSLLELVLAMVILSSAIVMMTGVWSTYYQGAVLGRDRLVASHLAASLMEDAIARGSLVQPVAPGERPPVRMSSRVMGRETTREYRYEVQVQRLPEGLTDVQVTVEYGEGSDRHEVVLETLVL